MGTGNEAAEGRTFKTVNGKVLGSTEGQPKGAITFVRPKELAANGVTGVVAEGIYEGTLPNNFDETKSDFKIRKDNGDLIVLNSSGSLASQLAKVATGSYVRITYAGLKPMTKGKMKGKSAHSFIVEIAD